MLECYVILTLFAHNICLHNIHFIRLIQIQILRDNTAYRKSAKKYRDMNFCSYRPALLFTTHFKCFTNLLCCLFEENEYYRNPFQ